MENTPILVKIKEIEKASIKFLTNKNERIFNIENKRKLWSPTQMQIMGYLINNSNISITQKDIEEKLNLSRATVSGVLTRMESNGLIERVADNKDLRIKNVRLTKKANQIFLDGQRMMQKFNDIIIEDIDEKELEITKKVLNKMKKNIDIQINNDIKKKGNL